MSLINEALKKARMEASQPHDQWRGFLRPSPVAPRRAAWPWIVAAVSVSLAAGVSLGVLWHRQGSSGLEVVSDPPSQTAAETGDSSQEARADSHPRSARAGPDEGDGASTATPSRAEEVEAKGESRTVATPLAPAQTAGAEVASASPAAVEARVAPAAPESLEPSARVQDGRSYLRRLELPGGGELALGGIAWSEVGPVALINGRALEEGQEIEGWVLLRIERQRVELQSQGVRVYLRMK